MAKARQQLLAEGASTYLDAVNAIVAYQHAVQEKCRHVLEARLPAYASAVRVSLTNDEVRPVIYPQMKDWVGDYWGIGVHIVRRDVPGIGYWESYCLLQLESVGGPLQCVMGEFLPSRKHALDVYNQIATGNSRVQRWETEVYLAEPIAPDKAATFDEELDRAVAAWIKLRQKTKGLAPKTR